MVIGWFLKFLIVILWNVFCGGLVGANDSILKWNFSKDITAEPRSRIFLRFFLPFQIQIDGILLIKFLFIYEVSKFCDTLLVLRTFLNFCELIGTFWKHFWVFFRAYWSFWELFEFLKLFKTFCELLGNSWKHFWVFLELFDLFDSLLSF